MTYAGLASRAGAASERKAQRFSQPSSDSLLIGEPGDAFEQEADRVADRVISASGTKHGWSVSRMGIETPLQRTCSCGAATGTEGECEDCGEQRLRRKSDVGQSLTLSGAAAPPIVHEVLRSPGQSLDAATRDFMEQRFDYDFSRVRVHTGARAAESASVVNALAYTHGGDVVFGAGLYAPGGHEGQRLLAHELVHVVQQSQAQNNLGIQRKTSRCCREVQTGHPILDVPASLFGYEHCWLKTETKSVGMGPAAEGPLPSWPFGTDTKLKDHSREEPDSCQEIPAVDENCVNRALVIGKPTGKWSTSNNCNTLADYIIGSCMQTVRLKGDTEIRGAVNWMDTAAIARIPIGEKTRLINRLLDGWVSDDDIEAVRKIYQNTPASQWPEVRKAIEARLLDLMDIGQRTQVRAILAGG